MSWVDSGARKLAVAVAIVLGLGGTGAVMNVASGDDEPTVYAYFDDASPLIVGNDVKSNGVKVGSVASMGVEDGKAKVGLALDEAVLPIHEDARATIRPVGLLGERIVDLDRGSASAPTLGEGGDISAERTGRSTDLDEVLNTVDEPTGTALSALVTTLGEGVRGRGGNIDHAIRALEPSLRNTDDLVKILHDQTSLLVEMLDAIGPLTGALANRRGAELDRLVASTETALSATGRHEEAFDATLRELPSALEEARATLRAVDAAGKATTPVLASLRPATRDLVELSRELEAFSAAAEPALDGLDPVLTQAKALLDHARPLAASLRRSGPDLKRSVNGARPVATQLLDNLGDVLDMVRFWGLSTKQQDSLSHYFRAHFVAVTETASGLLPTGHGVPGIPAIPDPTPELDTLRDPLDGLSQLGGEDGLLGGEGGLLGSGGLLGGSARSPRRTQSGSATGLSQEQETSLLDYMIGGQS